jgi:hypothetical protein
MYLVHVCTTAALDVVKKLLYVADPFKPTRAVAKDGARTFTTETDHLKHVLF